MLRPIDPPASSVGAAGVLLGAVALGAGGPTNLALTTPLVWVMVGIGTAGATLTFSFLVYALWKFRDPAARRRKVG